MARGIRTEDTTTLQMALVGYEIEKNKIEERIREVQAALGGSQAPAAQPEAPKRRKMSMAARRRDRRRAEKALGRASEDNGERLIGHSADQRFGDVVGIAERRCD